FSVADKLRNERPRGNSGRQLQPARPRISLRDGSASARVPGPLPLAPREQRRARVPSRSGVDGDTSRLNVSSFSGVTARSTGDREADRLSAQKDASLSLAGDICAT